MQANVKARFKIGLKLARVGSKAFNLQRQFTKSLIDGFLKTTSRKNQLFLKAQFGDFLQYLNLIENRLPAECI